MAVESIAVIGNCQADALAECLQMMLPGSQVQGVTRRAMRQGRVDLRTVLAQGELVFLQTAGVTEAEVRSINPDVRIIPFPAISFSGFHPDLVCANHAGGRVLTPLGGNNSAIALYGWMKGASPEHVLTLFRGDVYRDIGYHDFWDASLSEFIVTGAAAGLDLREGLDRLVRSGCFMHVAIHPRLPVMAEIARALLDKIGVVPDVRFPENYLIDKFFNNVVWPVYPEIGAPLGLPGEYIFRSPKAAREPGQNLGVFTLEQFVMSSFESYRSIDPDTINCRRFKSKAFCRLDHFLAAAPTPRRVASHHPYRDLPSTSFWRRAVTNTPTDAIDPVIKPAFRLDRADKIATAGSCFAQHISHRLSALGQQYFVTENGDHLAEAERVASNYGVYPARFGNIYTARQLVQLFDRAYGDFVPVDSVWEKDGHVIDPFRPEIEPDGFATETELRNDRAVHFAAVRRMFEQLDVFIFTLGLTEAWQAKADGAVFPVVPGATGATVDAERYSFVNFGVSEIVADLDAFIARLRKVNPTVKMIVTVSPVPIIATYEPRHVLVSSVATKSILRAAADEFTRKHEQVEYFPGYEIVTGPKTISYYNDDLRTVTTEGVDHVMRVFAKHYLGAPASPVAPAAPADRSDIAAELADSREIVCEEELLDP